MKAPTKIKRITNHPKRKWKSLEHDNSKTTRQYRYTDMAADTFSLFLRTKINFMKLFDLKPTSQAIENIATQDNNESLLNNIDLKLVNDTVDIICVKAICCPKCELVYYNKRSYNIHLAESHPDLLQFYCKICCIKFINRTLLQEHRSKHDGDKPYTCTKCNTELKSLEKFIAHMRKHQGKLPYTCRICKEAFDKTDEYEKHLLVHQLKPYSKSKQKTFNCEDCYRKFRKACDLERHRRVHTGEKPYICAVCGARFQQAHNMTKHMIIHTKEKKYRCDICTKDFGRKDVLTRHMLTHAVNKPFSCDICGKTFARALQLKTHKMKCH